MAYDVSVITFKGAELLAAASAANKLIMVGCDATQTAIDESTAASVTTRPSTPYSTTTDVTLVGSTDNHVFVRANFYAGQSVGGDVNTLYLYGHTENDASHDYVLAVLSSQTPFHLPVAGDPATFYGTLFDMIYTVNTESITAATTSVYATYAEFKTLESEVNALDDRTVTTHSKSDSSVGDDQLVLGNKTFIDGLRACEIRSIDTMPGDYSIAVGEIRIEGQKSAALFSEGGTGSSYSRASIGTTYDLSVYNTGAVCGFSVSGVYNSDTVTRDIIFERVGNGAYLRWDFDSHVYLGNSSHPFAGIYSNHICIGDPSAPYFKADDTQINISAPTTNIESTTYIDGDLTVYGDVTAKKLNGCLPAPLGNTPVGSIFLGMVASGFGNQSAGTELTATSTNKICKASIKTDVSGSDFSMIINNTYEEYTDGKFVLLSDLNTSGSGSLCVALLMCTQSPT